MLYILLSFFCIGCIQSCVSTSMTIIVNGLYGPKGELTVPKDTWQQLIKDARALRWYLRDMLLKREILNQISIPTAVFKFGISEIPPPGELDEVVLTLAHSRDLDFRLKEWGVPERRGISKIYTKFSVEDADLLFCLNGPSDAVGMYFKPGENRTCAEKFLEDIFEKCILSHVKHPNGEEISLVLDVKYSPIIFKAKIIPFFNKNFGRLKEIDGKNRAHFKYFTLSLYLFLHKYLEIGIESDFSFTSLGPLYSFDPSIIASILNEIKLPEDPEVEGKAEVIIHWVNNV